MASLSLNQTHEDVIQSLYGEIESVFIEAGAKSPEIIDLYHSEHWRYCQPVNPKNKSKIGYICSHDTVHDKPCVRIVVHSFVGGGSTHSFNSLHFKSDDVYNNTFVTTKRLDPYILAQRKIAEEKEIERKKHLFLFHKKLWEEGDNDILKHPYAIKKNMLDIGDARIADNKLLLPVRDLSGQITAIQNIFPSGKKLIFGKKKGGLIALGDIVEARQLYFCEGVATGHAIYQLVQLTQRRKIPFSVIVSLDNYNMETVVGLFVSRFTQKTFIVCPDNDIHKVSEHNGNAGMLSGLRCVLDYRCQCRLLPDQLLKLGESDWCDLLLRDQETACIAFAQKTKMTRFEAALARCAYFKKKDNSVSFKKACVRALNTGASMYPGVEDEKKLLDKFRDVVRYADITETQIQSWWKKIKRRLFGQSLRARSVTKIQSEKTQICWVDSLETAHQHIQVLKQHHPQAVFITNAPMGEGKTKHFIQPEFMRADIQGEVPVVITPTRSLTKGVSERFGCAHYIEDEFHVKDHSESMIPSSLAITVNSIISPKYKELLTFTRSVFIDEYTQVIRAITSGTVEEHQRNTTEKRLVSLIQKSDYTYIADADFNQVAMDHLRELVGEDREIILFSMDKNITRQNQTNVVYKFVRDRDQGMSHHYLSEQIVQAAERGEKLYVVSDSRKQLELITQRLEYLKIPTLLIHSDNTGFVQQKTFLDAPDAFLNKCHPQVVLASPAIQSGISIESKYFERCFGLYKGTVTPLVFQQMLHRVRPQKVFELSLPNCNDRAAQASENATAILTAAYQQHFEQFGGEGQVSYDASTGLHSIGNITLRQEGSRIIIDGDPEFGRFEALCAQTKAMDSEQRHHAANYLLLQAIDRGIEITPIELEQTLSDSERQQLKQIYREGKTALEAKEVNRILCAQLLDVSEVVKKTVKDGLKSSQDYYEVKRAEISKTLQQNSEALTGDDICFYQDKGHHAVANYQALLQGEEKAREHDLNDKTDGVAKTSAKWRESKVKLLQVLFEQLGINPHSGEGSYTSEQTRTLRSFIRESKTLTRYITFKLGLSIDSQLSDTAFINKIMRKVLGLKTERMMIREGDQRYWRYEIEQGSMISLKHYHAMKFTGVLSP